MWQPDPIGFVFVDHGEGRAVLREDSEVRSDGILHGGNVGVVAGYVVAGARGSGRCVGAFCFALQLYVRELLRFQRAFASIRFQELVDRYSSRFSHKIPHHSLYDSLPVSFLGIWFTSRPQDDSSVAVV